MTFCRGWFSPAAMLALFCFSTPLYIYRYLCYKHAFRIEAFWSRCLHPMRRGPAAFSVAFPWSSLGRSRDYFTYPTCSESIIFLCRIHVFLLCLSNSRFLLSDKDVRGVSACGCGCLSLFPTKMHNCRLVIHSRLTDMILHFTPCSVEGSFDPLSREVCKGWIDQLCAIPLTRKKRLEAWLRVKKRYTLTRQSASYNKILPFKWKDPTIRAQMPMSPARRAQMPMRQWQAPTCTDCPFTCAADNPDTEQNAPL